MGGFSTLSIASSGMIAAQTGLFVTGHNMANSTIAGYSRQRVIQSASPSLTIGNVAGSKLQTGLGVEVAGIKQIRNKYLDMQYRAEACRLGFHDVKFATGNEIEIIVGELQSDYKAQSVMQDLWDALNEMMLDPSGIETRGIFISTASTFITKIDNVASRLHDEQMKLNDEVISTVGKVNHYLEQVKKLNDDIRAAEISGDSANDYRDAREAYIDELSHIFDLTVKVDPLTGMVNLSTEGVDLLRNQNVNTLGLRYTAPNSPFVEPVLSSAKGILPYDPYSEQYQTTPSLYNLTGTITPEKGNDGGALKGMLVSRGTSSINYAGLPKKPTDFIIDDTGLSEEDKVFAAQLTTVMSTTRPVNIGALFSANADDYETQRDKIAQFSRVTGLTILLPSGDIPTVEPSRQQFINEVRAAYGKAEELIRGFEDSYLIPLDGFVEGTEDFKQAERWNAITMQEYQKALFNATQATIPNFQRQFDTLVNALITLVNDSFSPVGDDLQLAEDAPFDAEGGRGTEIFVRKYFDRFDSEGNHIAEDSRDPYSMYSMGNIAINPIFAKPENYSKIPYSPNGDESNTTLLGEILEKWKAGCVSFEGSEPISVENYYRAMIVDLAVNTNLSQKATETQMEQVQQADAKRMQLSGVSMDEELTSMMKYQHSYNAAARLFNIIDSMMDTLINRM